MKNEKVRVGQIGVGYWGPNLIRNMAKVKDVDVVYVADMDASRLKQFSVRQVAKTTTDYREILKDASIDAVVIATPASTHGSLALEALKAGKHVLIEKPLANSSEECLELVKTAKKSNLILMVGHTFLYNAAVRKVKDYIDAKELGDVFYMYSQRLNLGRVRQDVNALWNFAPHDISILLYLMDAIPTRVNARGFGYLNQKVEDVVFMTLTFPNGVSANVHVSWLDPQKVRKLTVVGSKKMLVYDDVSQEARIMLYDRNVEKIPWQNSPDFKDFAEFQLKVRSGDVLIPHFPFTEPLQVECEQFIEAIKSGKQPLTDGEHGLDVVRVMEAAERSMKQGGVPQEVS